MTNDLLNCIKTYTDDKSFSDAILLANTIPILEIRNSSFKKIFEKMAIENTEILLEILLEMSDPEERYNTIREFVGL